MSFSAKFSAKFSCKNYIKPVKKIDLNLDLTGNWKISFKPKQVWTRTVLDKNCLRQELF